MVAGIFEANLRYKLTGQQVQGGPSKRKTRKITLRKLKRILRGKIHEMQMNKDRYNCRCPIGNNVRRH
jgi:hypothetical protein